MNRDQKYPVGLEANVSADIRPTVKSAAKAFKKCPKCESPNLVHFEKEAFCTYCSWDSVLLRAEAKFGIQQAIDDFDAAVEREERSAREAALILRGPTFSEDEPNVA